MLLHRLALVTALTVTCAAFLLWFVADEMYFFWHMKLGDYFTETDRLLSLLLIAMLSAVVGLRATFIIEYAQISVPVTTVAGANALIHALSLLENEKQATFAVAPPSVFRP